MRQLPATLVLEHFPIGWNHPIGSHARSNNEVEHHFRAKWLGKCSRDLMRNERAVPTHPLYNAENNRLNDGFGPEAVVQFTPEIGR